MKTQSYPGQMRDLRRRKFRKETNSLVSRYGERATIIGYVTASEKNDENNHYIVADPKYAREVMKKMKEENYVKYGFIVAGRVSL